MAATDTLPTPIPSRQSAHEHAWTVESRHRTSDGLVVYVRCAGCTARRVDVQLSPAMPPQALSRPVGA